MTRNSEDHICEFLESINSCLTNLYFKRKIKKFSSLWISATGSFVDNRLSGKATIQYSNGARLEGEFTNGEIEGFCRFTDHQLLVEGIWTQNVLQTQL